MNEEIQRLQAELDADPEFQAALRLPKAYQRVQAAGRLAKAKGLVIPHGYTVDMKTGKIVEDHQIRNMILTGGAALGGAALPGLLGGMGGETAAAGGEWAGDLGLDASVNAAGNTASAIETATSPASSGMSLGNIFKWAAPVAGTAIKAIQERSAQKQNAEAERQRQAVNESNLDPFRSYMAQARDASRLNWMADQQFDVPQLQLDSKYGAGVNQAAPRSYTANPDARATMRAGADQIMAGDTAPLITPGTQPLPVLRMAAALRRRKAQPDYTSTSASWLS